MLVLPLLLLHLAAYSAFAVNKFGSSFGREVITRVMNFEELPEAQGSLGEFVKYVNQDQKITRLLTLCMPEAFLLYRMPIISDQTNSAKGFVSLSELVGSEHELLFDARISHVAIGSQCMKDELKSLTNQEARLKYDEFSKSYLEKVYSNEDYELYRIKK